MAQLKEREEAKTVREHLPDKREKSKKQFLSRFLKKRKLFSRVRKVLLYEALFFIPPKVEEQICRLP